MGSNHAIFEPTFRFNNRFHRYTVIELLFMLRMKENNESLNHKTSFTENSGNRFMAITFRASLNR